MSAIRVARGFTGRTKVVKFAGNYHGHSDALLAEGGSGVADASGCSGSAGVTDAAVQRRRSWRRTTWCRRSTRRWPA